MKIHMVKKGDTLFEIAKKYGVTVEEILQLNPDIQNPDVIDVGMKVKIPGSKPAAQVGDWVHQHIVKQGDTLWKLSKAWGVSLADMIKANAHLKNPNVLLTGEVVNIPKTKGAAEDTEDHDKQHAGKKFTGPIEEKKPTAPIVEPAQEAEPPIAPQQPVVEKKPELPVYPKHEHEHKPQYGKAIEPFQQFEMPAVEAYAPKEWPKEPEATMSATYGYPAIPPMPAMPMEHPAAAVNPCPPGMMPVWGDFFKPMVSPAAEKTMPWQGGYGMPMQPMVSPAAEKMMPWQGGYGAPEQAAYGEYPGLTAPAQAAPDYGYGAPTMTGGAQDWGYPTMPTDIAPAQTPDYGHVHGVHGGHGYGGYGGHGMPETLPAAAAPYGGGQYGGPVGPAAGGYGMPMPAGAGMFHPFGGFAHPGYGMYGMYGMMPAMEKKPCGCQDGREKDGEASVDGAQASANGAQANAGGEQAAIDGGAARATRSNGGRKSGKKAAIRANGSRSSSSKPASKRSARPWIKR